MLLGIIHVYKTIIYLHVPRIELFYIVGIKNKKIKLTLSVLILM